RLTEERDPSVKRALVLSLGGFGEDRFPLGARRVLAPELLKTYRDTPDPGLHSAAEWLLRRWGYDADLGKIDAELAGKPPGARRAGGPSPGGVVLPAPGPDQGRHAVEEGVSGAHGLPPADRGGVGTRLPGRGGHEPVLRLGGRAAQGVRLVFAGLRGRAHLPG